MPTANSTETKHPMDKYITDVKNSINEITHVTLQQVLNNSATRSEAINYVNLIMDIHRRITGEARL